mmetsp:Transcript_98275/g.311766  ORF Transcript_98275/g.311766 Transcript_98275/m.311766 type:complete len:222 (+) Transcript_98275:81-746(+)
MAGRMTGVLVSVLCVALRGAASADSLAGAELAACEAGGDECFGTAAEEAEPPRVSLLQTDLRLASSRRVLAGAARLQSHAVAARRENVTVVNMTLLEQWDKEQPADARWHPQGQGGYCGLIYYPTSDGGCCRLGWITTGTKKCVRTTCENVLKYACDNITNEKPKCEDRATWFSKWATDRMCTVDEHWCRKTRYNWVYRSVPPFNWGDRGDRISSDCDFRG